MPTTLMTWWSILCTAAVVNILAWCVSAALLSRRSGEPPSAVLSTRRWLLWLSAGYTLGCAFRSFLPMVDVPRMCLHDLWIARIGVGRSVATVAELCFAAQWAVLLREGREATDNRFVAFSANAVLPLIALAEICSWTAVLTTNYLLHAIENALWTLTAVLVVISFWLLRATAGRPARWFLTAACLCGSLYVLFMVTVDVPMYLKRWHADLPSVRDYLPIGDGIRAVLQRCTVVRDWASWHADVPWLTLYFTVAVWISIALAHAPALRAVDGPRPMPLGTARASTAR